MLALLYLTLIVAWAILVMVLKCKRAKAKRESETAATAAAASAQLQIIQIESSLYDIHATPHLCINCQEAAHQNCSHLQNSFYDRNNFNGGNSNSGFIPDDVGVHPAGAPPSYDEVMRLPNVFPQFALNNSITTLNQQIPDEIQQIELNDNQTVSRISVLSTNNTINTDIVMPSVDRNNKTL